MPRCNGESGKREKEKDKQLTQARGVINNLVKANEGLVNQIGYGEYDNWMVKKATIERLAPNSSKDDATELRAELAALRAERDEEAKKREQKEHEAYQLKRKLQTQKYKHFAKRRVTVGASSHYLSCESGAEDGAGTCNNQWDLKSCAQAIDIDEESVAQNYVEG